MVPSLSIRVPGGLSVHSLSENLFFVTECKVDRGFWTPSILQCTSPSLLMTNTKCPKAAGWLRKIKQLCPIGASPDLTGRLVSVWVAGRALRYGLGRLDWTVRDLGFSQRYYWSLSREGWWSFISLYEYLPASSEDGTASCGSRKVLGEQYRSLSSSLRSFLHSPVTSSLLDRNTLLNTLFSNTLNLRSSLSVNDHRKQQEQL